MKKYIYIIFFLIPLTVLCQKNHDFGGSDFYINHAGDSLFFPQPDSTTNNSKFYLFSNNSQTQEIKLLSNDTILTVFKTGSITRHFYYKFRKAIGNESYNNNPLVILKFGSIIGSRPSEYLLCVKIISYCANGNIKEKRIINSTTYELYSCNGNLYSVAEFCNSQLLESGLYKQYDTLNNELKIQGELNSCNNNQVGVCGKGCWKYYDQGKITSKRLFKDGTLIKEINYRTPPK